MLFCDLPQECTLSPNTRSPGLPRWLSGKESTCQGRSWRCRFDPCIRKSPWRRKRHPLQYSCLENPMDGGAWRATVHRVAKSWTRLCDFTYIKGKSFIGFPIGFNFKWKSNHYSQQTWVDPIAFNGFSSGTLSHLV